MFNVRPDALSPWLYVEPPQPDDPPGFRIAPDGSVIDAKRATPFAPFGNDLRAGTEPSTGTDFEAAIRQVAGGLYGPADLVTLPRSPVQEALDQIADGALAALADDDADGAVEATRLMPRKPQVKRGRWEVEPARLFAAEQRLTVPIEGNQLRANARCPQRAVPACFNVVIINDSRTKRWFCWSSTPTAHTQRFPHTCHRYLLCRATGVTNVRPERDVHLGPLRISMLFQSCC